jgi:hypothetical protein
MKATVNPREPVALRALLHDLATFFLEQRR